MRPGLSRPVLAVAALAAACDFSPKPAHFRRLVIEPETLRAEVQEPIPIEFDDQRRAKAVLGEYYQIWIGAGPGMSFEHFIQKDPATRRMRYGYFETNQDNRIGQSSRTRTVLQGAFGTVYSQTTCFYILPADSYGSSVDVHPYDDVFEHEEALSVSAEPPPSVSSDVTNVSIVRILRAGAEYLVIGATYTQHGRLLGFSVAGVKDGRWVHPNGVDGGGLYKVWDGKPVGSQSTQLERFGLPVTLSADEIVRAGRTALGPPSTFAVERDVFNVHYAYDRWIRQDQFPSQGDRERRYLSYLVTPEDAFLVPRCAERLPQD